MPTSDARDGIVVLFGGDGSEHRVSVASAQNVARHLEDATYWFLTRDGAIESVHRNSLLAFERPFEQDFAPEARESFASVADALDDPRSHGQTFFLALHGGSGEDGTLQEMLEARGLPFTGSNAEASHLAFDKVRSRASALAAGLRVAPACVIDGSEQTAKAAQALLKESGRVVVKPIADGSSHGVRFIDDADALREIATATKSSETPPLVAEAFVVGRELTIGVVERPSGVFALPCSEVRLAPGRSFDFEGKYLGKGAVELTPAPIDETLARSVQAVATTVHDTVGCRGYSRTDVIVDDQGPVFLEINTLPGLTAASFIPQQLDAAAIPFIDFLDDQVRVARQRTVR